MSLDRLVYDTVKLTYKPLEWNIRISNDFQVRSDYNIYLGETILRAWDRIAVREIEKISYQWPADWQQSVKERFAPEWFKKKWPVKYTVRHHEVYAHYPDLDLPNTRQTVVMFKNIGSPF